MYRPSVDKAALKYKGGVPMVAPSHTLTFAQGNRGYVAVSPTPASAAACAAFTSG